jgi:zinc protease
VGTEYAHHILKAATWELENLLRNGVSEEDVELSKNKAKVLYLNLAENSSRLLRAAVDDAYYGMKPGYLEGYLKRLDSVTTEQVNAAVQRYLQSDNLKLLIVTEADKAEALASDVRADRNAMGKTPADYRIDMVEEAGLTFLKVPSDKLDILRLDAVWEAHLLGLDPGRIRVVPVESLFETGAFITETATN